MNLNEKIKAIREIENAVKNHPLCLTFTSDKHHYIVIFPHSVAGVNGVQVQKRNQKLKSLQMLFDKLENFWRFDNPVLFHDRLGQ